MSTTTMHAHCSACSAAIVLRVDERGCYFVCYVCGKATSPRLTVAEADADVMWVPVTSRKKGEKTGVPRQEDG